MDLIVTLLVGGFCGWLASVLMKGKGNGLLMNIILGVIGSYVGHFVFDVLDIAATGSVGNIIRATVGAALVIAIARMISK